MYTDFSYSSFNNYLIDVFRDSIKSDGSNVLKIDVFKNSSHFGSSNIKSYVFYPSNVRVAMDRVRKVIPLIKDGFFNYGDDVKEPTVVRFFLYKASGGNLPWSKLYYNKYVFNFKEGKYEKKKN